MEDDGGERSSFVVGLIENRAKEVGMAAFDLRSASLHLSQYIETSSSYQNTNTLLRFYDPCVIIVPPNKLAADGMVGVSELVDRCYSTVRKVVFARGCFDDTKLLLLLLSNGVYILNFFFASLHYEFGIFEILSFGCVMSRIEAEKGVIVTNHSLTPLKDIKTINTRLNCLDELMSNEELFYGLSQVLRKFPKETDRVLCHFCYKPKKVTEAVLGFDNTRRSQNMISSIILLKTALDALPLLAMALKDAKCFLLANIYKTVCENDRYASIRKRVGEVIDDDVLHARVPFVARSQQCFALKAGIDGFLDMARRTFCDTSEAIHNLARKYREEFNLPNLKLPFNNRQGFFFRISQKEVQGKLPSKFTQVKNALPLEA
uniref:DNA mismatch repair protein MutS clamp domain-containing protein n=1 Tax=Brassica campestris TaxID=3711 RepID=M4F4C1_BRACM